MLLASNWLSALKLSFRSRAGSRAKRGGRRGHGTPVGQRVAAERLEPRCLLTSYNFVKIADSAAYSNLGVHPALSENGEVAFRASGLLSGGTFNIVAKGTGAPGEPITTIETDAGPYFEFGEPSINAAGTVVFWAAHDTNGLQGIAAGNGSAAATTLVTGSAAAGTNEFEQLDRLPDINDSGDIAFMGDRPDTTGVFHRAVGGAVEMLAQESDGYQPFTVGETFVSLNTADGVSFNAKLTSGDKVIAQHTGPGPGGVRTNLRDSSGSLDAFSRTSISQDGDVLSNVSTDAGAQSLIRYSNAGAVENVQVTAANPGFVQFDSPNLTDNVGGMVFRGVLSGSGVTGIYTGTATGSDPVADKVIENGDTLDGKVISTIAMGSNAANSAGKIAFFVSFTDGSFGIFRADPEVAPVPVPTTTRLNIPPFATEGTVVTLTATVTPTTQGGSVPTGTVEFVSVREVGRIAFGSDVGFTATVRVLNESGTPLGSFSPYPTSFLGGVRVALGDVNGDGVAEVITAPGPGGDNIVHVFSVSSGGDGSEFGATAIEQIAVSDPLIGTRGLNIASADVNADGFADIIVSGGPKVIVYSGQDSSVLHNLTPFGTSISEVRVAVGDLNGDSVPDVIVATGPGVAPSIKAIDPTTGNVFRSFAPFESTFRGGVNVAVGDVTGDGFPEILAAKGPGSLPQVKVFQADGSFLLSELAFASGFRGGVRVAVGDVNGDGVAEFVLRAGVTSPGTSAISSLRTLVSSQAMFYQGDIESDTPYEYASALEEDEFGSVVAVRTHEETVVGTAALDEDGVATLETDDLDAGVSSIDARYNGSTEHHPSASGIDFIEVRAVMDFGDAPSRYGTLFADDGPRHRAEGPMLGSRRDAELDGQPSLNADFDDTRPGASDDEDGVTFMSDTLFFDPRYPVAATVTVEASAMGILDAFIDYNRDGQFGEFERLDTDSLVVQPGRNLIRFYVPEAAHPGGIFGNENIGCVAGSTIARFRISSLGGLGPTGEAEDGEVEDYRITLSSALDQGTTASLQLPSEGPIGAPNFASFDVFVDGGLLTLAGRDPIGFRSPLFQMPFDGRQRLEIMGTPGDDTLRLDLSGSDVSMQDFHFDGGGEATASGDGIEIIGGDRVFTEVGVEYSGLKDGVILVGASRIGFEDLEPITVNVESDSAFVNFTPRRSFAGFTELARGIRDVVATVAIDPLQTSVGGTLEEFGDGAFVRGVFEPAYFRTPKRQMNVVLTAGNDQLTITSSLSSIDPLVVRVDTDELHRPENGNDLVNWQQSALRTLVKGYGGHDTFLGGSGSDTIFGDAGEDLIEAGGGANVADGGTGNDIIRGGADADVLNGGVGNDLIQSASGNDTVFGGIGADTVSGGDGNDVIAGDEGSDSLQGDNGDDVIHTGANSDSADGGSGNDVLTGDGSDFGDLLIGGVGNDTLDGSESTDVLSGGEGNDVLSGLAGGDLLSGGTGNDSLDGGSGDDQLDGQEGDDSLTGGVGTDVLNGESGSDSLQGGEDADFLSGGIGNDVLHDDDAGKPSNDTLDGGAGDDVLLATGGGDALIGGTGDDRLDGGLGADTLEGNDGNDVLFGGADNDSVSGGDGADQLFGGSGDDVLAGQDGDDVIASGDGNDSATGGDGNDRISGELGNDLIGGGEGRDSIDGGLGDDSLAGGDDNDSVNGGVGNDQLFGQEGNDVLNGNDGNDALFGGDDDDVVAGGNGNDAVSGDDGDDRVLGQAGNDTVSAGEGVDTIDGGTGSDAISEFTLNATLTPSRLTLDNFDGDTEVETLRGIERAQLSAAFSPAGVSLNASAFRGSVTLVGSGFNDTITGGNGADSIDGGFGDDIIGGGLGNDTMDGGGGADQLKGGEGHDSIKGGDDNDKLFGENGNDTLNGGAGNDSLDGGLGNDGLSGFTGNDTLLGGDGTDTLIGGGGDDSMLGGAGNDIVLGKSGKDIVKGDAGTDTIAGGSGTGIDVGDAVTRDAADLAGLTAALAAARDEAFVFNAAWIDEI